MSSSFEEASRSSRNDSRQWKEEIKRKQQNLKTTVKCVWGKEKREEKLSG